MLNIKPDQIIEIFENYEDPNKFTICYWTTKELENGKYIRCKAWEQVPRNEGAQMAEAMNKIKKQEEDFERRNGVTTKNAGSGAEQREREILRKVRGQKIPQG